MKHASLFLAFLVVCIAAPALAQTPIAAPAGWTTQTRASGATVFTPPDLATGEVYSVAVYEAAALEGKTLEEWLRAFAGSVGTTPGQLAAPLQIKVTSKRIVSGIGAYVGPGGKSLGVTFVGVSLDGDAKVHVSRTLFSQEGLLGRYQEENAALNEALLERAKRFSERIARPPNPTFKKKATPGPLKAASLGGARVFVKYWFDATTTPVFEHLLLFPDGTAFDDIPDKPLPSFSAATLRKMLPARNVGRWKETGKTLLLTFPGGKRTLAKGPKGWFDTQGVQQKGPYHIYFPIGGPPRARLVGAWESQRRTVLGTAGGEAPMVTAGSSGDWIFNANGTYSDGKTSFASATSGGAFSASVRQSQSEGKWRLDGPLLTLEKNGERTVHLAFLLPHWTSNGPSSTFLIDGDRWERSKAK